MTDTLIDELREQSKDALAMRLIRERKVELMRSDLAVPRIPTEGRWTAAIYGAGTAADFAQDDDPAKAVLMVTGAAEPVSSEAADRIAALTAERDALAADLEAAAGELLIDSPTPGTDMARMLIANRLLCRERDALATRMAAFAGYADKMKLAAKTKWETGRFVEMRAAGNGAHDAYADMARRLREGSETE